MEQNFPTYAAVPPNVRVRWIEDYSGLSVALVRETRTWAGHAYDNDHLWCDHTGAASVSENHAMKRGVTRDGTVLGFAAGTLLVSGDDGRILTLHHNTVRRLS
jgi:hypothetical protein